MRLWGQNMKAGRLVWLDALRLCAGLSMVGLHATSDAAGQPWTDYDVIERVGPVAIRSILYIARTELFIIISAFLLIMALGHRPRSYSTVLSEQTRRLIIPFLFWTVFYAFYSLWKASEFGYLASSLTALGRVSEWVGFFLLGDVKYHMHFVPTLFGVLLFYPIFRLGERMPALGLVIFVFLVTKREIDALLFVNYWGTEVLPWLVRATKILTYVGYGFVAAAAYGMFKRCTASDLKKLAPIVLYAGLLALSVKFIGAWKTIESGAWPFSYEAGYWADFLMPALLFLALMTFSSKAWPRTISELAKYSFGMYLCHPIFLDAAEIFLRDTTLAPIAQVSLKILFIVPSMTLSL